MLHQNIVENKYTIRKVIFIPMSILFLIIIGLGIGNPKLFYSIEKTISNFQYDYFAWLYALVAIVNIFVLAWLAFSKHGDIILGGKGAKPLVSRWDWFCILLCGGIGTGIVFWGIAEPIYHLNNPIPGTGDKVASSQAALDALSTCMLHWGFPSYAHYCIFGVAVAYAVYNMKLPYRISSVLYPIFGKKVFSTIGDLVDNIALFAITVSVSAILAVAALQFGAGFLEVFHIKPTNTIRGVMLLIIVVTFIISSYTGLYRGIKILSDLNTRIFFGILIFILIFGSTKFTMFFTVESIGHSIDQFFPRMTYLSAIDGNKWPMWWTIIYWIWMIVYAPMVGLFLGKLGKGRSIREFIMMNLVVPASFAITWFGVFGSNSIKIDLDWHSKIWSVIQEKGLEASTYSFLENFPLPGITSIVFMVMLFLSVVTLCDSMTSTVASLSIKTKRDIESEAPKSIKIFWGLIMSSVAFLSVIATSSSTKNAIDMIQSTKLLPMMAALPVLFIFVGLIVSVILMFVRAKNYNFVYHPKTSTIEKSIQHEDE